MCILLDHLTHRKTLAFMQDNYAEVQRLARDIEDHSDKCYECLGSIERTDDVIVKLFGIVHTQENK